MKRKIGILVAGFLTFLYAGDMPIGEAIDTFWIWIALFALGIISVLALFVFSMQTQKMERMYQKMFEKQVEMEKHQTILLSSMGENIHDMIMQALKKEKINDVENTKQLFQRKKDSEPIEDRLLTITNDLIAFLRLKSGKVHINNEKFNLNNVLNEISGDICSKYKGKQIDLIFDINNNVPRHLVGDSLRLGQVINSILEYMMVRLGKGELKLEIMMYGKIDDNIELQFQFDDTGEGLSVEEVESIFNPYYDEESGSYHRLGLFVSNELVKKMKGEISVQSQLGKGTSFIVTLPLKIFDKENKRIYRLPQKELTAKKVFIVDSNYHSALAIKKTFAYFKHEIRVVTKEQFLKNMPNLNSYDIVVIHNSLFNHKLVHYLNKIKMEKELKVVSLNALLNVDEDNFNDDLIDFYFYMPLNQERVFEMIVGMYDDTLTLEVEERNREKKKILKTDASLIQESKNITQKSFSVFSEKKILIVEDNMINQKVLSSLLKPVGVKVSIANNGQEAIDMIKEGDKEFDLILMDINMPVMDGYTATELIRRDQRFDSLPIIAFTALLLDSEIKKMYACGINAFLAKPLNIGKLYTVLALFLLNSDKVEEEIQNTHIEEKVSLKGLNIDKGMKYANGNEVLYAEVLREFIDAYGKSDTLFEKLVREHRYEQLKMLCIDMRGLTGTIGAYDMLDLINKIHQAILYKKQNILPSYIIPYQQEIGKLNASIKEYISFEDFSAA